MTYNIPEKDIPVCCHLAFDEEAKALRGGQNINPPRMSKSYFQEPVEYVTLHSKRNFADVIKDFEMRRGLWIIQVNPKESQGSL